MRRRMKVALAGAVVVVLGGGAAMAAPHLVDAEGSPTGATSASGMRTATVERGALAQGTILSGTLTRGQTVPLNADSGAVLTWLPDPGAVLGSGDRVFESNGRPTFLLNGKVPLWRPLHLGDRGADVRSLNEALAAAELLEQDLVDDVFGLGTSSALARLYTQAAYEPPSGTEDGRKAVADARDAVQAAHDELEQAVAALAEASRGPAALEIAAADAAVESAAQALEAAKELGEGVSLAQAEYDAALTDRAALDVRPDVSPQQKAVSDARKRVSEAAEDLEIAQAESISPQDVVILDGAGVRVSAVPVRVGDSASGPVLHLTEQTVRAEASVTRSQQASLTVGDTVQVTLPDGERIPGTITSTSATAESGGGDGAPEGAGTASALTEGGAETAIVTVELAAQDRVSDLAGAAVRIEVSTASVEDALVVPVTALTALAEGGYAVEKVMPDSPPGTGTLVAVEIGLIAEARVQVSSAQLAEGDEVLIP